MAELFKGIDFMAIFGYVGQWFSENFNFSGDGFMEFINKAVAFIKGLMEPMPVID